MGVSREQAAENRRAIVAAAEKLFRERGVDAVGLAELMKAAGFTQGGFYNHFKSKDALVAAVMEKAMEDGGNAVASGIESARAADLDPLRQRIQWYLSPEHRGNIDAGCPLSGFAGDARRLGAAARDTYAKGLAANREEFARWDQRRQSQEGDHHVQPDGRYAAAFAGSCRHRRGARG
jgi:TetR/AcrR family transcriptional repressor of nem operon